MNPEEIEVPYVSREDIRKEAGKILSIHNPEMVIPVNAEEIIEIQYGIDIIPAGSLKDVIGIDGLILSDFSSMYIDRKVYDTIECRYIFSIAHEFGHLILHESIIRDLRVFNSVDEAYDVYNRIPSGELDKMEFQANCFAGYFLVPEEQLLQSYSEILAELPEPGLENSDSFHHYISNPLARKFNVSPEAMFYRLQYMRR